MKTPWWLNFAKIGHAAGVAIGTVAGVAQFVPGPWSVAIGAVAGLATVVTHYADQGIAAETPVAK
jgi:hypothetical protein